MKRWGVQIVNDGWICVNSTNDCMGNQYVYQKDYVKEGWGVYEREEECGRMEFEKERERER